MQVTLFLLLAFSLQLLPQPVLSSHLCAAMVRASLHIGSVMGSMTATTMRSIVEVCWQHSEGAEKIYELIDCI